MPHFQLLVVGARKHEREQLKAWMQLRGHQIWFAEGARGALRVFEEVTPDVVVLDTLMGGAGPHRVAAIMQQAAPKTRVLFLLNHAFEDAHYGSLTTSGPTSIVYRPLDPRDLVPSDLLSSESEGTLGELPTQGISDANVLTDLLIAIYQQVATGMLFLEHEGTRKLLYFVDGHPAYAESNLLSENLGKFLLRRGVISQVEFEWARNLQLNEGIMQGEALVKIGVFSESDLYEYLRLQSREKISQAFELTGARYHFELDHSLVTSKGRMRISLLDVVAEGLERALWPALDEDARTQSMAYSLQLLPESRALLEDCLATMPAFVRSGLREGRPVASWAPSGDERGIAWSFAEAMCRAGIARPVSSLDEHAINVHHSWVREIIAPSVLVLPTTLEERVREVARLLDCCQSAEAHEILGVKASADPDEIDQRLIQLQQHYGSERYSADLPIDASMQLAEVLEIFRSARDRMVQQAQRRRTRITSSSLPAASVADPRGAEESLRRGIQAMDEERYHEAQHHLTLASRLHAQIAPEASARLVYCTYKEKGDNEAKATAQRQLAALLERHPYLATAYHLLGRLYEEDGDFEEAQAQYRMALQFDDGHEAAMRSLERLGGNAGNAR